MGDGGLGDKPLRIAFAGAGAISTFHLTGWRAMLNAQVVAICDPILDKARARAAEFDVPTVYADFATMLDQEQPDAVEIATPVGTHAPLVRLAAERSVHVSCQKPLTSTVAEAEALIAAVGGRVRFMVHENFRFRPHYVAVRDWLREGRIGEPRHASLIVRGSGLTSRDGTTPAILRRQPYLQGFKRLLVFEALIHHLDVLRSLLGPLTVVSARLARRNAALAGEDVALIILTGKDRLDCLLDGDLSAPGYPALSVDRLEISGTQGTLLLDFDRLTMVGGSEPALHFDLTKNYQACFTTAIQDFVNGLRTGDPFQTDRLDNLETLRLMEACYVAAGVREK